MLAYRNLSRERTVGSPVGMFGFASFPGIGDDRIGVRTESGLGLVA